LKKDEQAARVLNDALRKLLKHTLRKKWGAKPLPPSPTESPPQPDSTPEPPKC
jgi:hypothetical protein